MTLYDASATGPQADPFHRQRSLQRFAAVRAQSLARAAYLSAEDQCVQSMPDASPVKWHLAHTTWFFETMLLRPLQPGYRVCDERYPRLFNSYYESLGPRHPRPQRGLLTRPSIDEVHGYRAHVDAALAAFIAACDADTWRAAAPMLELGLQHEQQHQELLLTDIQHALSMNPLQPALWPAGEVPSGRPGVLPRLDGPSAWVECAGGEVEIGHSGAGFTFDNETPAHRVVLLPYALASRPVSCGEYLAFIRDGGYRRADLWLSEGWAQVQAQGWTAPLYWSDEGSEVPLVFTLQGVQALREDAPVCHLSFYEAAAYAEWAGARLPTEFEWEAAARTGAAGPGAALRHLDGAVWQWTRSSYDPYPRFRPAAGAVGEYNGKFMVGQIVLRGGSCATPAGHSRATYRNFFPPSARWQFSGLRLAQDRS